ncbi:MAG: hypothetical protein U5R46_19285 [Gammaproteobacteria bacterium]|nr:hypothetical protein [Gammaproteobacteria bacterium]
MNRLENPDGTPLMVGGASLSHARLQATHQIERQNTQHLPGAIGLVALRRNAVEGEAVFRLRIHLLVRAPAAHEKPKRAPRDRFVGHNRRVLIIPIIRIEQIQLEVLPCPARHLLSVNHHPQRARPSRHPNPLLEALDASLDPLPAPPFGDSPFQAQPLVKRYLDRVLHTLSVEHINDVLAEKCPIYARLQHRAVIDRGIELPKQILEKRQRGLAVMHVPRPVLNPQHLPRVGLIRRDRVITRYLEPVRVETPPRSFDLQARRHHRTVHIHRQPPHGTALNHRPHQLLVDTKQRRHSAPIKGSKPAAHCMQRRYPAQARYPLHQRIAFQLGDIPNPSSTRDP